MSTVQNTDKWVFISYAASDASRVRKLRDTLQFAGIPCWVSEFDLRPGGSWTTQIAEAVAGSALVLLCLTQDSASEVGAAEQRVLEATLAKRGRPNEVNPWLLPVRLDAMEWPVTSTLLDTIGWDIGWVEFTDPADPVQRDRLLATITRRLGGSEVDARRVTRDMGHVLPVYLLLDTSASMHEEIEQLNHELASFIDEVLLNPVLADRIRLSVISFGSNATVVLEAANLVDQIPALPRLVASGSTSYRQAFARLEWAIRSDNHRFAKEGARTHRPLVFFLTDGTPDQEDWRTALADLKASARPTICAMGLRDVNSSLLSEIATSDGTASLLSPGAFGPSQVLRGFFEAMTRSVLVSTDLSFGDTERLWLDFSALPEVD